MKKFRIAIIGAGFSGVILAEELQKFAEVKIFEKSRGTGGRMSTRYAEDFSFDHGLQYFTVSDAEFQQFLNPFILTQDVVTWDGDTIELPSNTKKPSKPRFVAAPNMNSLCKKIAKNLDINLGIEIAPLQPKANDGWHLQDKAGNELGIFDLVISTAPVAQTENLFGNHFPLNQAVMKPCFALMLGFAQKWSQDWVLAKVKQNPIKLIAVNSSKPQRNDKVTSLVIQSSNNWTKEHLEDEPEKVQEILLQNFSQLTEIDHKQAQYISLHRWRYALVESSKKQKFCDLNLGLAATSDWICDSKLEDIWLAAMNLCEEIKRKI